MIGHSLSLMLKVCRLLSLSVLTLSKRPNLSLKLCNNNMSSSSLNPLLSDWTLNKYGLPPFDAIEAGHFKPAFHHAMSEELTEIDRIATNKSWNYII